MAERRYYWLKLKKDFFNSKRMKKLRAIAGGDTYTIIYLKMLLKAIESDGILKFEMVEKSFADEIALDIDESPDDVGIAVNYLLTVGLIEAIGDDEYALPECIENIGSESASAKRVREFREREKSIALQERSDELLYVPYIDESTNQKRYNGNYYHCMTRDNGKCAICGDTQNLCLHHIDGYDKNRPETSAINKMITLCRECHSKVHNGMEIPKNILDKIDYFVTTETSCNANVTPCNACVTERKSIEKEIEKEKDTDINKQCDIVIDYLNTVCGSRYKHSESSRKHIRARINEGFSVDDCKTVVDKKKTDWTGTKYETYLRPETLFGSKFESYLNSKTSPSKSVPTYMNATEEKEEKFWDD